MGQENEEIPTLRQSSFSGSQGIKGDIKGFCFYVCQVPFFNCVKIIAKAWFQENSAIGSGEAIKAKTGSRAIRLSAKKALVVAMRMPGKNGN